MTGERSGRGRSALPGTSARSALVLRFVLLLMLAAGCGTGSGGTGGSEASPQHVYVQALDKARKSLFQGDLAYDDPRRMHLEAGQQTPFHITVSGGWRNSTNAHGHSSVDVGAIVSVRLRCHGDAVCSSDSSVRQPVLTKEDRAQWIWWITPRTAGPLPLSITVTTYLQNSDTVLRETTIPLEARAKAEPRGFFTVVWDWLRTGWGVFVGFTTGVGAVWGTWSLITGAVRRLRRSQASADDSPEPHPEDTPPPVGEPRGTQ